MAYSGLGHLTWRAPVWLEQPAILHQQGAAALFSTQQLAGNGARLPFLVAEMMLNPIMASGLLTLLNKLFLYYSLCGILLPYSSYLRYAHGNSWRLNRRTEPKS